MPVSNLLKSWRSNTVAILLAMPLSTSVAGQQMEEVVVIKAFTPDEKLQTSEVSELLDADDMSIAGDSDIGAALKRLPGLSLVGGRFIYVRGLGERYSSTYVNGTSMPSPEPLQRAVPLDLFDTSVVKNVLVQKTHSANYGIEFSGGIVDIRTAA
ncbi:MAG: TonB-dependent receptor plug domain-containing protein, partial [Pseudomonadales bacterium]|nr:TonB-dependent receptor plug domain-containing protein [Pseudomonadales bacterium]